MKPEIKAMIGELSRFDVINGHCEIITRKTMGAFNFSVALDYTALVINIALMAYSSYMLWKVKDNKEDERYYFTLFLLASIATGVSHLILTLES